MFPIFYFNEFWVNILVYQIKCPLNSNFFQIISTLKKGSCQETMSRFSHGFSKVVNVLEYFILKSKMHGYAEEWNEFT